MGFVFLWREAPMPPLEGEVVERQRNRRGLFVNRAVQETPQSAYGCQLPFQGRPWQNQNPPPFNAQLNFPTLRADASRPYGQSNRTAKMPCGNCYRFSSNVRLSSLSTRISFLLMMS